MCIRDRIKNYLSTVEAELMGKNEAAKYLQDQIVYLLENNVSIKCIGDTDTDEVYSYVVYDLNKIYFIYTKNIYRKNGLANRLIRECKLEGKQFSLIINSYLAKVLANKYNLTFKASFKL